jgi:hypothetical protein
MTHLVLEQFDWGHPNELQKCVTQFFPTSPKVPPKANNRQPPKANNRQVALARSNGAA